MEKETKRLKAARARRTKLEKVQHKAVVEFNKNPESKAAKKKKLSAMKRLEHQRKVVKALEAGKKPPKSAKKSKPKSAKKSKPKSAKKSKPKSAKKSGSSPAAIGRKGFNLVKKFDRDMASLKKQLESANKRAENLKASSRKHKDKEIEKLNKQRGLLAQRIEKLQAAEAKRRARHHGKKGHKKNPIGSGGWKEHAAAGGGVLTAIVFVCVGDRLGATHKLTKTGGGTNPLGLVDAPFDAKGHYYTYNKDAEKTPIWSDIKHTGWKRLTSAFLNIAVPLFVASRIKTHTGWKTYFQLWGYSSLVLVGGKVVIDGARKLTGKTAMGARLFAPEINARNTQLALQGGATLNPADLPTGPAGYGNPDPAAQLGAGKACRPCDQHNAMVGAQGKKPEGIIAPPNVNVTPPQASPRPVDTATPAPMPPAVSNNGGPTATPTAPTNVVGITRPTAKPVGVGRRAFPNDGPRVGALSSSKMNWRR